MEKYDVVVCGGGLAGVCAAIASARNGVSTVLLQERAVLGGNSSSLAGVPPHGATALGHNRTARESGILEELRMAYFELCPESDNRQYWDLVLLRWCEHEPNLTVHLNTKVLGCEIEGRKITSVDALQMTTECRYRIEGSIFVDATGDAILAMEAGAPVRMGREGRDEFSEIYAPPEPDGKTLGSTIYLIAFKRNYPVRFSPPPGAKTYTRCSDLKNRHHNLRSIIPINSLSPDDSTVRIFWWFELGGERHIIHDNETIYSELVAELMGVWDHLKNRCDGETREALANYDLVWWSTIPLRRESRRVEGEYMLREDDIFKPKLFPDRIGYGGFPVDLHPPEGLHSSEPPCLQVFLNNLYSVPYRALVPKNVDNLLLGGRCISASHVALGTVRVMFTLGSLGQAAGTAAALCRKSGFGPRDLIDGPALKNLQQRLLQDDCYIIGIRNEDPGDLAGKAEITASSRFLFQAKETDGFLELRFPTIQQIPFTDRRLESFEIFLKSTSSLDEDILWKLYIGERLGVLPEGNSVRSGTLRIGPKESGWFTLSTDTLDIPRDSILTISIDRKPGIHWGFSGKETFGTRCAVSYTGPLEAEAFHGDARIAPLSGPWIFLNHHGRLPALLADSLKEIAQGPLYNRELPLSKPSLTLNCRITPGFSPYHERNITNGFGRAEDFPNMWISDPADGLPQTLTLRWKDTQLITNIIITFDTNLDLEDRFYGFPRERFRFSFPVPECVSDYEIEALTREGWIRIEEVKGNRDRRRTHILKQPAQAEALRLKVTATNGAETARIYEIRVY
jgi:hypothetical protein